MQFFRFIIFKNPQCHFCIIFISLPNFYLLFYLLELGKQVILKSAFDNRSIRSPHSFYYLLVLRVLVLLTCFLVCLFIFDSVLNIIFEALLVGIIWSLGWRYLPPGSFFFLAYPKHLKTLVIQVHLSPLFRLQMTQRWDVVRWMMFILSSPIFIE